MKPVRLFQPLDDSVLVWQVSIIFSFHICVTSQRTVHIQLKAHMLLLSSAHSQTAQFYTITITRGT